MPKFSQILFVFRKEFAEALRDKRSLRMAFLMPLYFVGMFVAVILFAVHSDNEKKIGGVNHYKIPVQGEENLPGLIQWLKENGADIQTVDKDAFQKVKNKSLEFALVIPEKAKQTFAEGDTSSLWLIYDASNPKVSSQINFVRAHFGSWNQKQGALTLLSRGIDTRLASPAILHEQNIADERKMGIYILGSLPMTLILAMFVASMGFSADMTAGERERRSLESLLITPTSSSEIYLGKWLTSFSLTLIILLVQLILLGIAFNKLPFNQLGLRVQVSWLDMLNIWFILLPVAFISVSLQLTFALFAKSFKDAQALLGLLMFVPMVPTFYTLFNPGVAFDWWAWTPVLAQSMAIKQLVLGEPLVSLAFLKAWLCGIFLSTGVIYFGIKKLRTPKIIYGQ